jgi:hypothetical protein
MRSYRCHSSPQAPHLRPPSLRNGVAHVGLFFAAMASFVAVLAVCSFIGLAAFNYFVRPKCDLLLYRLVVPCFLPPRAGRWFQFLRCPDCDLLLALSDVPCHAFLS